MTVGLVVSLYLEIVLQFFFCKQRPRKLDKERKMNFKCLFDVKSFLLLVISFASVFCDESSNVSDLK